MERQSLRILLRHFEALVMLILFRSASYTCNELRMSQHILVIQPVAPGDLIYCYINIFSIIFSNG